MNTEQIMEIAEDYADAAANHAHECSTPNELTLLLNGRATLQSAIEALVQERDALKLRRLDTEITLTGWENKYAELKVECKVLRDALCKELVNELVGVVCQGDGSLTRSKS